jgi:general secretion pathway protein E
MWKEQLANGITVLGAQSDETIKSFPKDADFIAKAKLHNASLNRRTLLEDGLYKAILGLTTIKEVLRVAG